jgi:uncharacterized membrane protein
MELFVTILTFVFAGFFAFAGIMHIIKPQFFKHFIPKPLPKNLVNYVVGILELAVGVGLLFSQFVKESAMGIMILLVLFLPIHIWDVVRERPAIGSKKLAIIRVPIQFVLFYFAYLIYSHS